MWDKNVPGGTPKQVSSAQLGYNWLTVDTALSQIYCLYIIE